MMNDQSVPGEIWLTAKPEKENFHVRETGRALIWDGERLVISDETKWIHLPGGGVEADEDFAAAVIREIQEEAGLDAEIVRPIVRLMTTNDGTYSHPEADAVAHNLFLVRVRGGTINENTHHDEAELERGVTARWMTIQEARERVAAETSFRGTYIRWALDWLETHVS